VIYKPAFTNRFKKDAKRAKKQNKPFEKLNTIIKQLCALDVLPAHNRDHDLTGNWKGYRECHIEPDWLLIYCINHDEALIELIRLGSHSNLFK